MFKRVKDAIVESLSSPFSNDKLTITRNERDINRKATLQFLTLENYIDKHLVTSLTLEAFVGFILLFSSTNFPLLSSSNKRTSRKPITIHVLVSNASIVEAMGLDKSFIYLKLELIQKFRYYLASITLKYCSEFNVAYPSDEDIQNMKILFEPITMEILDKSINNNSKHSCVLFVDSRTTPKEQEVLDLLIAKSNESEKIARVFFFKWKKYNYEPHKKLLSKYSVEMFKSCHCLNQCTRALLFVIIAFFLIVLIIPSSSIQRSDDDTNHFL